MSLPLRALLECGNARFRVLLGCVAVAAQVACASDSVAPGQGSLPDPCEVRNAYSLGAVTSGTLTTSDCVLADGSYIDYYTVVLSSDTYTFDMSTAGFPAFLVLYSPDGEPLAVHNDLGTTPDTAIKAIVPPGTYIIGASSFPGVTGTYLLKSQTASGDVANCEVVFVTKGSNFTQTLTNTDCVSNTHFSDEYYIYLAATKPITVTMRSTAFDPSLEMYDRLNLVVAANEDIDATNKDAQFTFTARSSGFYRISARGTSLDASGAYTLSVH